jgi:hypothetical protein
MAPTRQLLRSPEHARMIGAVSMSLLMIRLFVLLLLLQILSVAALGQSVSFPGSRNNSLQNVLVNISYAIANGQIAILWLDTGMMDRATPMYLSSMMIGTYVVWVTKNQTPDTLWTHKQNGQPLATARNFWILLVHPA